MIDNHLCMLPVSTCTCMCVQRYLYGTGMITCVRYLLLCQRQIAYQIYGTATVKRQLRNQ